MLGLTIHVRRSTYCIHKILCVYIYIYREREREREDQWSSLTRARLKINKRKDENKIYVKNVN